MALYSVISYNFGQYDLVRTPRIVDPDAEYIFVTDVSVDAPGWNVVVDDRLNGKNPIYAAYYVRYHPFEYAHTDIVITLDASIQIQDSLRPIVDEFIESGADYAPMLTNYPDDEVKLSEFHDKHHRVTDEEVQRVTAFIRRFSQTGWKGSIGCAFAMYRNTRVSGKLLRNAWRFCLALGTNGVPCRLDEVVLHKVLFHYATTIRLFIISIQIIQSTYMIYCEHGKKTPFRRRDNFDQRYYICNFPVSPIRFSKEINFPRSYKYETEAMLLTRYLTAPDLRNWLSWHITRCGFDRVHVFDNASGYDVKSICEEFGNRVTYELIEGHPRQYKLYDCYVNWRSNAKWIMPIDDDEYLDIGDFERVIDAIGYYERKFDHLGMLAVRWKHLFPKDFSRERDCPVMEYCTEENPKFATKFMRLGDRTVKCIVKRYGEIHYEETWENGAGGHVPLHSCYYGAMLPDGRTVTGCGVDKDTAIDDERIRLLHFRYTGEADWKRRHSAGSPTVSDAFMHMRPWLDNSPKN